MARRSVQVMDVVEILQHWYARRPKSQIAVSVGADRGRVAKYVAKAEQAGIVPGGAPIGRDEWAVRVRAWFPELVDAKARSLTYPDINRLRNVIEAMLTEVTVSTAFQRCRDEHGLTAGVALGMKPSEVADALDISLGVCTGSATSNQAHDRRSTYRPMRS